jgi:hypothetical protein
MISLEMAKKLKDAGLLWDPQDGDWSHDPYRNQKIIMHNPSPLNDFDMYTWFPRLDQLLTEIELREYGYRLIGHTNDNGEENNGLYLDKWNGKLWKYIIDFQSKYDDEATVAALLWVLEQ